MFPKFLVEFPHAPVLDARTATSLGIAWTVLHADQRKLEARLITLVRLAPTASDRIVIRLENLPPGTDPWPSDPYRAKRSHRTPRH